MFRRCPSALLRPILLSVFSLPTLLFAGPLKAVEPEAPARVDPSFGPLIAEAVADAAARLGTAPCALLLSDFVDTRSGLTLAENLAASGRTAPEHVRLLLFRSAPGPRPFGGRKVFAFTAPASPVVFLCRDDLLRIQNQPRLVTAIVLHEVLHSLGLRDDRPSSVAITERVLERCF